MLLRTALALAKKGFAVFPCQPRAKEPATPRGFLDASKDPHMLRHWWGLNPSYNVAIATGDTSGIFVVDIDGMDAELELRKLEAEHGQMPVTVEALTARGRHLYFKMPDVPVRNSAGKIAAGVDTRGVGGYVLAPPSIHPSGRAYAWSVDSASSIADAPDWLLARIAKGSNGNGEATPPEVWRELVAGGVDEGQRDCTVAKLAGHLLRRFVDAHVVLELMQVWNAARCRPPLPAEDVTRIVDSICGAELRRRGRTP
jgi:hypothetical protein